MIVALSLRSAPQPNGYTEDSSGDRTVLAHPPEIQAAMEHLGAGRFEPAKSVLRALLARQPGNAHANKLMAIVHGELYENEQAYFYIQRAAAAAPADPEAHWMVANVAMMLGKHQRAAEAYRRVLALVPDHAGATDGLVKCMISLGEEAGALAIYGAFVARHASDPTAHAGHAGVAQVLGLIPEAIAIYDRAIEAIPGAPLLHEERCYTLNFTDAIDPVEHRNAHEQLARLRYLEAGSPPVRGAQEFSNTRDGSRPLRVAFVSGDLGHHPCAFFLEGLVRALDPASVVPYWYAQSPANDSKTAQLRPLAHWRDITAMDDAAVVEQALADSIDVAIDCNGWTGGHRLGAFARRLAPIQITYLGYPNTTGLATMDYRIVDEITDPLENATHCTERLIRMPGCFLCFTLQGGEIMPAARATGAPIVFGSLNRLSKIVEPVMRAWSRVLARVPGSTLLLNARVQSNTVKSGVKDRLAAAGIDLARVHFREFTRTPDVHLRAYDQIDISLDTFPYNGTTTTFESLMMGVPVVTIAGSTHRARVGASILHRLGLDELAALDVDGYVEAAVALAEDRARLMHLRSTLPARVRTGPLTDARAFARGFEAALCEVWGRWCAGERSALSSDVFP
jgi:predicted O-linked N-acetylglucosamine transferase (SPINDLY family)